MIRAVVLALAVIVALPACGGKKAAPSAGETGPAGTVVELAGEVTAAREGQAPRPLTNGAEVFADDTVTTAAGARVVITLARNGVRWTLEGGKSRRVDQSAAWNAPRGAGEVALGAEGDDRTAAAGRHAEKEAAEGAAEVAPAAEAPTMPAPGAAPVAAPEPAPAAEPAQAPAPRPRPKKVAATKRDQTKELVDLDDESGGGGGGGSPGSGAGAPKREPRAAARVTVKITTEGALSRAVVDRVVRQNVAGMRYCYEKALAEDPTLAGTVTLTFTVGTDGRASAPQASGSFGNATVIDCARHVIGRLAFPTADAETRVTAEIAYDHD